MDLENLTAPATRRNRERPSGFVAFLDVMFASIGVFIAVIVIQATLVRSASPPAEADVYAVLMENGWVIDLVSDTARWREAGLAGASETMLASNWIERLESLAERGGGTLNVEIAHGSAAIVWRMGKATGLQKMLAEASRRGSGPARVPAFFVVWRPLQTDEDPVAYLAARANLVGRDDAE